MRQLAARLIVLIGSSLLALSVSAYARAADVRPAIRQVFLIQNSGWMEPFYKDPKSHFKLIASSLVAQSDLRDIPVTIATFNQDGQTSESSPQTLYSGSYSRGAVDRVIDAINLPRKADGAYADADFNGALHDAISKLLGGREGIIWMLTNNKDSPDNSQAIVQNTRKFYSLLRGSPYITRIAAFLIRDDLYGPNFHEKGCVIYVLAYGDHAAAALDMLLRDGSPTRALFRSPPIRIKPLDRDPVELRLAQADTGAAPARLRDGVLEVAHVPGSRPIRIVLRGVLKNTYYPQNIDAAYLDASWYSSDPTVQAATVSITPNMLSVIPARADSGVVTIILKAPAIPRAGPLFGILDNERIVRGYLQIRLSRIRFSLAQDFLQHVSAISGADVISADQAQLVAGDQLPDVFYDYRKVSTSTTVVPVAIEVTHSPVPLVLTLAVLATTLGGGGFLLLWAARGRTYLIPVGTGRQPVTLRPFEHRVVSDSFGTRATVTGALFGPPRVRTVGDDLKQQGR